MYVRVETFFLSFHSDYRNGASDICGDGESCAEDSDSEEGFVVIRGARNTQTSIQSQTVITLPPLPLAENRVKR